MRGKEEAERGQTPKQSGAAFHVVTTATESVRRRES